MTETPCGHALDSTRCAAARTELQELEARMCFDELRVMRVFARRLLTGQERYGFLDLSADYRNFKRERAEEYIDLAIYDACDELDVDGKDAPWARDVTMPESPVRREGGTR